MSLLSVLYGLRTAAFTIGCVACAVAFFLFILGVQLGPILLVALSAGLSLKVLLHICDAIADFLLPLFKKSAFHALSLMSGFFNLTEAGCAVLILLGLVLSLKLLAIWGLLLLPVMSAALIFLACLVSAIYFHSKEYGKNVSLKDIVIVCFLCLILISIRLVFLLTLAKGWLIFFVVLFGVCFLIGIVSKLKNTQSYFSQYKITVTRRIYKIEFPSSYEGKLKPKLEPKVMVLNKKVCKERVVKYFTSVMRRQQSGDLNPLFRVFDIANNTFNFLQECNTKFICDKIQPLENRLSPLALVTKDQYDLLESRANELLSLDENDKKLARKINNIRKEVKCDVLHDSLVKRPIRLSKKNLDVIDLDVFKYWKDLSTGKRQRQLTDHVPDLVKPEDIEVGYSDKQVRFFYTVVLSDSKLRKGFNFKDSDKVDGLCQLYKKKRDLLQEKYKQIIAKGKTRQEKWTEWMNCNIISLKSWVLFGQEEGNEINETRVLEIGSEQDIEKDAEDAKALTGIDLTLRNMPNIQQYMMPHPLLVDSEDWKRSKVMMPKVDK